MKSLISHVVYMGIPLLQVLLLLGGCGSKHYVEVNRKISNDLDFAAARTVVLDVSVDNTPFVERDITIHSSRILKKGMLQPDRKIIEHALSEAMNFDGKSVLTMEQYRWMESSLASIRPPSGYRSPKIDALVRLKVSFGIQSGRYEQQKVYRFFRKATRCQYLKNPPKDYKPCQEVEDRAWDEIHTEQNALGRVDLWYAGEIFLNRNDEFQLHRSIEGAVVLNTAYEDERAISRKVAAGLGNIVSNELGIVNLKVRLQIDEGNHSDSIRLLKQGSLEQARRMLEQDIDSNWFASSTDFYNLGLIYHTYGELKIASKYYDRAIKAGGYKRIYIGALNNLKVLDAESTLE